MSGPQRLLMAGGSAAPFDPVTSLAWNHLWYVGGPEFVALGLADGGQVATWPDEIGSVDATQGTAANRPLYRSAAASFNNQPCVDFDGSNDNLISTAGASVAGPYSVVLIVQLDVTTTQYAVEGPNSGSSGNRVLVRTPGFGGGGTNYDIYAGGGTNVHAGGTATTGIHTLRSVFGATGTPWSFAVDGTVLVSGPNAAAGPHTFQGVTLGGVSTVYLNGRIALFGVYAGDITAAGSWAAFQSWCSTTYGKSL